MYNILNHYIRKVIISSTIVVFLVLISLSSIIRLVDELRKIEEGNYSIFEVIIYIALSLPKDFELFFPIATLLGGLLGLSVLEVHNEFIAMQVSGFSRLQIALSVIKASVPVLLCSIISNEWVVPNSEKIIHTYRDKSQYDTCLLSVKFKNLWFIDNNDFVYVERVVSCSELLGVKLYNFDEKKKLKKIFYVNRAVFISKVWHLIDVNELDISDEMCIVNNKISHSEWHAALTPYKLSMLITHPNVLSISKLYHCTKYFNKVGQSSKYYQMIFWNKISSPISGSAMTIMALACTFGPLYKKKTGFRLFIGSIVGFLFYILNQIFGTLGIIYNIPPIIGSISPSIIFLVISTIIIWIYS
ncbi:LPS export ABC transporter permease LptG [Blochmannia endosymbiont of Camponotus sp.]|uniref:LPS export ABC transporter permease LptG n=1 Tax=Blochmannia endosymbiont of Camponotus sp. TaxID=700220 RepID=UPI002023DFF9|nr:LPS export ABC transporter permease LptG [Blochmannia endosymbiont of Camponotus sp.]URJ29755.1 LPS export ABC transporter permease LptG [Blochmannia endosymbiont of Camponotus sp.]